MTFVIRTSVANRRGGPGRGRQDRNPTPKTLGPYYNKGWLRVFQWLARIFNRNYHARGSEATEGAANRPELVQFGDLRPGHFRRHPIWIQCHTADYDAPWYDETDEETFRPRLGDLPAAVSEGMLLVAARFTLQDGTELEGFLTPAPEDGAEDSLDVMGTIQPHIFLPSGSPVGFWEGMVPRPVVRQKVYEELGRSPEQVFPIQFSVLLGLVRGVASGQVQGYYWRSKSDGSIQIDT